MAKVADAIESFIAAPKSRDEDAITFAMFDALHAIDAEGRAAAVKATPTEVTSAMQLRSGADRMAPANDRLTFAVQLDALHTLLGPSYLQAHDWMVRLERAPTGHDQGAIAAGEALCERLTDLLRAMDAVFDVLKAGRIEERHELIARLKSESDDECGFSDKPDAAAVA